MLTGVIATMGVRELEAHSWFARNLFVEERDVRPTPGANLSPGPSHPLPIGKPRPGLGL